MDDKIQLAEKQTPRTSSTSTIEIQKVMNIILKKPVTQCAAERIKSHREIHGKTSSSTSSRIACTEYFCKERMKRNVKKGTIDCFMGTVQTSPRQRVQPLENLFPMRLLTSLRFLLLTDTFSHLFLQSHPES